MEGRLNRSRAWLRITALCVGCAGALSLTPAAGASVTIGQVPSAPPPDNCTTPGVDYLEPSVTGGNLYVAKQAGTITSWSTNSSGSGAIYVVKIFRRTSDPESFQVVAHSPPHILSAGLNTVSVSLPVKSGDMLGLHERGSPSSCTFNQFGDTVLIRDGDLADGASGTFAPLNGMRLNLSAVLVPDNQFTLSAVTRNRKNGSATITITTSNPGLVTVAGKGMKKRAPKSLAVAGPLSFSVVAVGKARHRLARKGSVVLPLRATFFPTAGDPSTQPVNLKLKLRKTRPPAPTPSP
jgi:hypothetical protein